MLTRRGFGRGVWGGFAGCAGGFEWCASPDGAAWAATPVTSAAGTSAGAAMAAREGGMVSAGARWRRGDGRELTSDDDEGGEDELDEVHHLW